MEISGSILQKKISDLFPEIGSSLTAEVLNKICNHSDSQPFLKWFVSHVTRNNVLSDDDIQIKQHLLKTGKWFTDDLTNLVDKATENYPELRQIISPELAHNLNNEFRYRTEKEALDEDLAYLRMLEESTETLKEEEERLIEDIECEQIELDKDGIDVEERYEDCVELCRDFEDIHKLLNDDVEQLLNVYADAAEMKGPPVVWTQLPLEVCKSQTEMYINYLSAYIKRQFGNNSKEDNICDSDYDTFMEDSRDRRGEEMLQELSTCLRNLTTSRIEEVSCKISADACSTIEELAVTIYNNGNPKLPQSQAQLELEIIELSGRRDFLEENVRLLRENRLEEVVTQSAELAITEIVLLDARLRYERREHRLSCLLSLRELAREHGHAHSDLLCILMELQYRRIIEAVEFVADARYYLSTEYSLSSVRDNVMHELENEYKTISSSPNGERNPYNKIFTSMMNGNVNDIDSLTSSMRQLEQLVRDNEANEEKIFGFDIYERINRVKSFEERLNEFYNREINSGRTSSLIPMSVEVATRMDEAVSRISQYQSELLTRRNRLKEKLRKNVDEFEWETEILWQRFLVDPESLKKLYDDAEKRLEQMYFGKS